MKIGNNLNRSDAPTPLLRQKSAPGGRPPVGPFCARDAKTVTVDNHPVSSARSLHAASQASSVESTPLPARGVTTFPNGSHDPRVRTYGQSFG
jgi:hypothetical protein